MPLSHDGTEMTNDETLEIALDFTTSYVDKELS